MNFYAASVELRWTTAMSLDGGREPRTARVKDGRA